MYTFDHNTPSKIIIMTLNKKLISLFVKHSRVSSSNDYSYRFFFASDDNAVTTINRNAGWQQAER